MHMYCNLHCIHSGYVAEMTETRKTYEDKAPDPLNSQYPNRRAREEAIEHQDKRRQKTSVLFPPGKHIYICIVACICSCISSMQ